MTSIRRLNIETTTPPAIDRRLSDAALPWFVSNKGIEAYRRADNYLVLDFETTNKTNGLALDPGNSLVLACWTVVRDGVGQSFSKFGDQYEMEDLVRDVSRADFVVAHNAKFELQWLERCGVDLRKVLVYDTMVMEWVLEGNKKVPFNLEDTSRRYGYSGKESLVSKLIKYGICPSLIPRSWLKRYCETDVHLCHQLFLRQAVRLTNEELWHIALQRNLVIPVLADIELQGLQLDTEKVYAEEVRLQAVVEELGQALDKLTGGINLGSPAQLRKFLYEELAFPAPLDNGGKEIKTDSGAISTAVPALEKLVASTDRQKEFLKLYKEYNLADTLLTKNVAFFKKVCDQKDGVFFGSLNQCRTANHRLASGGIKMKFVGDKKESGVQLQNLPRKYKKLFTCHDPDYVVTEYDGSQIEFRVAADLGHDKVAENGIVSGEDIHSFTRDTMNAAYIKYKMKKEIDRQGAKPQTFAPLYGAFGKDKAEQEYAQAFRAKYCQIYNTQQSWTYIVADQKKLKTPYGLTFHWPYAKMHGSGYVSYSTEIFNLPISGLATAEIIPIALVYFWHRIDGLRTRVFNTVHDSIIVRNHKDDVDLVTDIAKQCMTRDVYRFLSEVYKYEFHVPLGFGMKTGTHWGVAEQEHKWDVWPNGDERYQIDENKTITVVYDTRVSVSGE